MRQPCAPMRGAASIKRMPAASNSFRAGPEIRHGVRDMMHSLAALGQVTRDRTVRVHWSNQFDPACPGAKRRYLDRLLGKHEPLAAGKSKRSVTRQCLIEVGHDNRDMVQHRIDRAATGSNRDWSLVRGDGNVCSVVWSLREGCRVGKDRQVDLQRICIFTHDQATFAPSAQLEVRAEHPVGDGNGMGRPFSTVLDDDGNSDLRIIERREAGEPGVLAIIQAVFVGLTNFRRPGLAADV